MARLGITIKGSSIFTLIVLGRNILLLFTTTLPAIESGLSNHVLKIGPPYTSVFNLNIFSVIISGFGFILNPGESVCEPNILNPFFKFISVPSVNATTVEFDFFT